jgi:hypothetical protein
LLLVGLTALLGAGLGLISAGILLLAAVVAHRLRRGNTFLSTLTTRLAATSGSALAGYAGATLLLVGVSIRFSPSDLGMTLAAVGLVVAAGFGLYTLLARPGSRAADVPYPAATLTSSVPNTMATNRPSDDFRHQISDAVFGHAQRASWLTFGVALTFFAVGMGIFALLAYGVYLQVAPSGQANELDRLVQAYTAFVSQSAGALGVQQLLTVFALQFSRVVPILALMVIGWVGGRVILNATRISQRKVLQDSLSQLGPLQSTLAGLPPRRPVADALEETLKQAKRSFAVRTWLSVVLFGLGIALFVLLFVYAWGTNLGPSPFVVATIAGSGVTSFVLSMIANRQREIRDTLDQIAQLQLEIAERAQRSDILDLYVAQLVKEGLSGDRLDTLREALNWLEPSNTAHSAHAHYTVPNNDRPRDDEGLEHWPTENPRVGALMQEGRSRR